MRGRRKEKRDSGIRETRIWKKRKTRKKKMK